MPKFSSLFRYLRQWRHLLRRGARIQLWVITGLAVLSLILLQRHITIQARSNPSLDRIATTAGLSDLAAPMLKDQPVGAQSIRYPVPDNAYFVAPDGKEENSGLRADSPWPLSKALKDAPSNATIVLRGGTYRTGYRRSRDGGVDVDETTIPRRLTLQPYEGEQPVLKGSLVADRWLPEGRAWKTTWEYHFPPSRDSKANTKANPVAAYNDGVWINGEPLWQVGSRREVKPGNFYFDDATNTLYIGNNPSGQTVEVTAFGVGLRNWQMPEKGVVIQGLTFMHYANTALDLDCPEARIENNIFTQNRHTGIFVGNPGVRRYESYGVDATIRNNDFIDNGAQGLGTVRADRLLFENNLVKRNNIKLSDHAAGGVKFVRSDSVIVRHNLFEDNIHAGVWFDVGSTRDTIVNNVIQRTKGLAIFWEISDQSIIAGNLLVENDGGIGISGSANTKIYNNTFYNNRSSLFAGDFDRRGHRGPGYIANTVVKNNLFSLVSHPNSKKMMTFRTSICEQPLVSALDYNGYYRRNLNQPKQLIEWEKYPYDANCPKQNGTPFSRLADFQAEVGFEQHGVELHGSPDPLFVDAVNGNYALQANAPALNRGEPLPADIADALGWPSGRPVDLGAYQLSSSASPKS